MSEKNKNFIKLKVLLSQWASTRKWMDILWSYTCILKAGLELFEWKELVSITFSLTYWKLKLWIDMIYISIVKIILFRNLFVKHRTCSLRWSTRWLPTIEILKNAAPGFEPMTNLTQWPTGILIVDEEKHHISLCDAMVLGLNTFRAESMSPLLWNEHGLPTSRRAIHFRS